MTNQTTNFGLGHNNPPTEAELFAQGLTERNKKVLDRAAALLGSKIPEKIEDDEQSEKVTLIIKQFKTCQNSLEESRKIEKAPFDLKGNMVQAFFKGFDKKLEEKRTAALKALDVYIKEKDAQRLRELEEERKRQIAEKEAMASIAVELEKTNSGAAEIALEDALAAELKVEKFDKAIAAPTGRTAIRTDAGVTSSLSSKTTIEEVSRKELDLEALRYHFKAEHVQMALNAYLKSCGPEPKAINGAKISTETKTVVR